jgi:hypothetical protein
MFDGTTTSSPGCCERKRQRVETVANADTVGRPAIRCPKLLEAGDLRARGPA